MSIKHGPNCLWVRLRMSVAAGMRRQSTSISRRVRVAALWAGAGAGTLWVNRGEEATCVLDGSGQ
jgi:hypothetical protein